MRWVTCDHSMSTFFHGWFSTFPVQLGRNRCWSHWDSRTHLLAAPLVDWPTCWVTRWLTRPLDGCLIHWFADPLIGFPTYSAYWQAASLTGSLIHWMFVSLTDSLTDALLTGWLPSCLAHTSHQNHHTTSPSHYTASHYITSHHTTSPRHTIPSYHTTPCIPPHHITTT